MKLKHFFRGHPIVQVAADMILLHSFMLGEHQAGLITISTYEGRRVLDVRRFVLDYDADGSTRAWRPSAKGLRIPPEQIESIVEALSRHIVHMKHASTNLSLASAHPLGPFGAEMLP